MSNELYQNFGHIPQADIMTTVRINRTEDKELQAMIGLVNHIDLIKRDLDEEGIKRVVVWLAKRYAV